MQEPHSAVQDVRVVRFYTVRNADLSCNQFTLDPLSLSIKKSVISSDPVRFLTGFSLAIKDSKALYLTGSGPDWTTSSAMRLNLKASSASWMPGPNLLTERSFHSSCVMAQKLFVVGGTDMYLKPAKKIEFIDLNRW